MNEAAILSLIADLYAQVRNLQAALAEAQHTHDATEA